MDLDTYLRRLREDLLAAAAIGDEEFRRAATVLSSAIEPSARLAIMNALSDLAAEVTGALESTTVDIKLDGRDVKVTVTRHHPGPDGQDEPQTHEFDYEHRLAEEAEELRRAMQEAGGDLSRTTVRLLGDIKAQAEQAASHQGVSLNTYISRAIADSLRSGFSKSGKGSKPGKPRAGRTVTGYIQA